VKAQLFLAIVVGVMVYIGLLALGIKFPILLATIAGFTELIPIIGPILGAIPGIFVTLATAPEKIVWVALLYLAVQVLENSLLVPRIQSQALRVHPVAIMLALVIGSEFAGLYGIILGPPLLAAAKEVFFYARSWNPPRPVDGAEPSADGLVADQIETDPLESESESDSST
jgi:predicted PurR-regulated permease PerM